MLGELKDDEWPGMLYFSRRFTNDLEYIAHYTHIMPDKAHQFLDSRSLSFMKRTLLSCNREWPSVGEVVALFKRNIDYQVARIHTK